LHDIGEGIVPGGRNKVEIIDVIFAFSNVKLVREIVQDNIKQLNEMNEVGKGQTEGLKNAIMQKQMGLYTSLSDVEKILEGIIDNITPQARIVGSRDIQLDPGQSQALAGAILFAINHMIKFIPGADLGNGLPQSMA